MEDKVVKRVLEAYKKRSKVGIEKYGTTLERKDLSSLDWLQHLQEELMDATLYLEALKSSVSFLSDKELAIEYFSQNKPSYTNDNQCIITGIEFGEEDTYNKTTGCPYANFVEKFRAKNKIPVADLREFVEILKDRI